MGRSRGDWSLLQVPGAWLEDFLFTSLTLRDFRNLRVQMYSPTSCSGHGQWFLSHPEEWGCLVGPGGL